jgi:hypothetical protein
MLKLFYVEGTKTGYDTYSDFVCAAESASAAKRLHPNGRDKLKRNQRAWEITYDTWDETIDTLTVVEIGTARPEIEPGVICASFHAG